MMTSVTLPPKLSVREEDLCALLANTIEASGREPQGDIQLFLDHVKGYLRIRVQNRTEADVLEKNPAVLTTKEDCGKHGIGLSVVRSIAAKYQGDFQARWENGYFCVTVMLLTD